MDSGRRSLRDAWPSLSAVVLALLAASAAAAMEALRRAGSPWVRATVIAAAACGLAAVSLVLGQSALVALGAAVLAVATALGLERLATAREGGRRGRQIPIVAEHLADALGAGMSLTGALASASEITPEPMAGELRTTSSAIRTGQRVEGALEALRLRVSDPALEVMINAITIQRTSGGDLSSALRSLSEQLSERERLTREVRGATAQARMTGALVASLPVVAGVGLEVARPGLLAGLLSGPALALVTTSVLMQGAGILLIRRIARVDI